MIKYFKELEKPNDFKINKNFYNFFSHNNFSIKIYIKYYKMLKEALKNLNVNTKSIDGYNYKAILFPNSWYILPRFLDYDENLYNTCGINGHKDAHLKKDYQKALNNKEMAREIFIRKINKFENDITCLNKYLNDKEVTKKIHLEKIETIVLGNILSEFIFWDYFSNLKKDAKYYQDALKKLNKIILDDFLIRCVGFHKIISIEEKTLSTSDVNYQEDFYEYLKNGWNIDFVKPLAWNDDVHDFCELDDNIVKIKQFHNL